MPPRPTHTTHRTAEDEEEAEGAVAVATEEAAVDTRDLGGGGGEVTPFVGSLTDWRAWVAQQGGNQPGQTPPFMFPGVGPITDLNDPRAAVPPYNAVQNAQSGLAMPQLNQWQYVPTSIKPADPFAGWTPQLSVATPTLPVMVPPQPPTFVQITSITPNTGPAAGGTAIQIFGSGFNTGAGAATAVNFVNAAGTSTAGTAFSVVNDRQINVTTPTTGLTAHTMVTVTVVSPNGNASLYNAFIVP